MATASASPSSPPSRVEVALGELGDATLDLLRSARDMYSVFVRTLYYIARGKREPGAVVHQMY
ncbi:MAG: ABC transporter permease, partial [Deltaproteobacteria bacterium HGW-Deltaproteobacteria-20]